MIPLITMLIAVYGTGRLLNDLLGAFQPGKATIVLTCIVSIFAILGIWFLIALIGRTVQAMLRREKYEDFGTIEGYFRSMTKGNRFECEIHDAQSGLTVHCYFKSDDVAEQAWSAFMKERVAAHGLVRYDKEGCPTSIVADTVRFFPAESELPTVEDIQAIYRSYKK